MKKLWTLIIVLLGVIACEARTPTGILRVEAPGPGRFDVYRIANEAPLQFVSEDSGHFNEDLPLAPGSYLVLADCSSETVIIYPGQKQRVVAHQLRFVTPLPPSRRDSFSIQCSRSEKTRSRQHLNGRYELTVLHGKRDLLVGMVPMSIDFQTLPDTKNPRELTYKLAAVQVGQVSGNDEASYFISPANEMMAATKYQEFGHWEFLLPGQYVLEVNGTRMNVTLSEDEKRVVKPALLKVSTSPGDVDLGIPARVKGSPWLVEINSAHWLNFNETYPVLPGHATLAISGSNQSVDLELIEGATFELKARSVTVHSGCASAHLGCLGTRGIFLYLPDEPYPFMESITDIPVLFIDTGKPVYLGIEGSRDISVEIAAQVRDKTMHLGFVKLIPQPQHKPGQVTDLVRVDTMGLPWRGHTLDINLEKPTLMPLVVGTYRLEHYVSSTLVEAERRGLNRNFVIEAGRTIELEIPVYLSEKKWLAYRKKNPQISPEETSGPGVSASSAPDKRPKAL